MNTQDTVIYDELLDLLAESADSQRIRAFRLSQPRQIRLDSLLEKNRTDALTADEKAELDSFEGVRGFLDRLESRIRR